MPIAEIWPRHASSVLTTNWIRSIRPSKLPPAPSGPPTTFGPSSSTLTHQGPQRIATPLTQPVPTPSPSYAATTYDQAQPVSGPDFDWNAESDNELPLPPASIKISPRPNWAPPTYRHRDQRSELVHKTHPAAPLPRPSLLHDWWLREIRPVGRLATTISPS